MDMIKVYFTGLFILVAAIVFNGIASALGLMSWYDFLSKLLESGKKAFLHPGWLDYLWLMIGYPFLLGISVLLSERFLKGL